MFGAKSLPLFSTIKHIFYVDKQSNFGGSRRSRPRSKIPRKRSVRSTTALGNNRARIYRRQRLGSTRPYRVAQHRIVARIGRDCRKICTQRHSNLYRRQVAHKPMERPEWCNSLAHRDCCRQHGAARYSSPRHTGSTIKYLYHNPYTPSST